MYFSQWEGHPPSRVKFLAFIVTGCWWMLNYDCQRLGMVRLLEGSFLDLTLDHDHSNRCRQITVAQQERATCMTASLCYTLRIARSRWPLTVVPIRLSRKDARKLDLLVKLGIYRSRTEAIRAMIQMGSDEQVSRHMMNEAVLKVLNRLLEYEKSSGRNPLRIISEETAAEIVAEGRQ